MHPGFTCWAVSETSVQSLNLRSCLMWLTPVSIALVWVCSSAAVISACLLSFRSNFSVCRWPTTRQGLYHPEFSSCTVVLPVKTVVYQFFTGSHVSDVLLDLCSFFLNCGFIASFLLFKHSFSVMDFLSGPLCRLWDASMFWYQC